MRLIFLGPAGAGKGTQARIFERRFGARQISTGDILREQLDAGTELGRRAESFMQRGALVPDQLIIGMIESKLEAHSLGFVMDGFPRTVAQAEAFDALLSRKGWTLDGVILFTADRDTLITRLSARWTNPRTGRTYNALTNVPKIAGVCDEDGGPLIQRADDTPATAHKRLDVYDEETRPLAAYYRQTGKLVEVDALRPVEDVARAIAEAVESKQRVAGSGS